MDIVFLQQQVDGHGSLGLWNRDTLLKPLKLLPVRPDDDEDVEANEETEDARIDKIVVAVDKVSNQLDQVEEKADDGQNNPGHHKTRLALPSTMDEQRGNNNVADADNQKNCHHGR